MRTQDNNKINCKFAEKQLPLFAYMRQQFSVHRLFSLCRMEVEYEPSSTKALLRISPVEIEDDADYKCEITYWEVREHCDIVQIIKLTTLGEYF